MRGARARSGAVLLTIAFFTEVTEDTEVTDDTEVTEGVFEERALAN